MHTLAARIQLLEAGSLTRLGNDWHMLKHFQDQRTVSLE
jgi:hypothetical protein